MAKHPLLQLPKIHEVLMTFMSLGTPYVWGGKVRPLTDPIPDHHGIDCSGAFQWLIYQGSGATCTLPEGSIEQREFFESRGFKKVKYSNAIEDKSAAVYACFSWGVGEKNRHVWLVRMGASFESWGGHGPGVRSPNSVWHRLNCRACFLIAKPFLKEVE